MPINVTRIVSEVQNEINDLTFEKITISMYSDLINDALRTIGEFTQVWIKRYIATPRPLGSAEIKEVIIPYQDTLGNVLAPYNILQLFVSLDAGQNWVEGSEHSYQVIGSLQNNNFGYPTNRTLGSPNNFRTQIYSNSGLAMNVGDMLLAFPVTFMEDEQVQIDYISLTPGIFPQWKFDSSLIIPDFMYHCLLYYIKYRIFEKLFNQGMNDYSQRYQLALQAYEKNYKPKCQSYARQLRDMNSPKVIQPHIYLPKRGLPLNVQQP